MVETLKENRSASEVRVGISPTTRVGAANIILPNLIGVHLVDLQSQLKLAPKKSIQPTGYVQVGAIHELPLPECSN